MLKTLLAKLGLRRHADDESYGAETTSKEARRAQDSIDASHRRPPDDDSSTAMQPGEEPPGASKP